MRYETVDYTKKDVEIVHLLDIAGILDQTFKDCYAKFNSDVKEKDLKEPLEFVVEFISNVTIEGGITSKEELALKLKKDYMDLVSGHLLEESNDYNDNIIRKEFIPNTKGEYFVERLYYYIVDYLVFNNCIRLNSPYLYKVNLRRASSDKLSYRRNSILYYTIFLLTVEEY